MAAIGALLAASSYVRFRNLRAHGIAGSDTFQYWEIAWLWRDGHFVLNNDPADPYQFFRPTHYLLNTIALGIWGARDYALRAMVNVFETLNVALVFGTGYWFLGRSFAAGLVLAIAYALLPTPIVAAQFELPHTYSTTFLLAMTMCLAVACRPDGRRARPRWLVASGLFGGLAATTHGSLTFAAPVVALMLGGLALSTATGTAAGRLRVAARQIALFAGGFAVPYVVFGALVGYGPMVSALLSERSHHGSGGFTRVSLFWSYLTAGTAASLSPAIAYAFLVSLVVLAVQAARRRLDGIDLTPVLLVAGFCALMGAVFQDVFMPRLFLPLNALVLLTIAAAARAALPARARGAAPYLCALLLIPMSGVALRAQINNVREYYSGVRSGPVRPLYDRIGARVTPEARLLVGPYLEYYLQRQFRARVYFGDNAVYLLECDAPTLDEFVRAQHIRYVFLSTDVDLRVQGRRDGPYARLGACSGLRRDDFTNERDLEALRMYLSQRGASPIPIAGTGDLYVLPDHQPDGANAHSE